VCAAGVRSTRYFSTRFRSDVFDTMTGGGPSSPSAGGTSAPPRPRKSASELGENTLYHRARNIRYDEVTDKLGYLMERCAPPPTHPPCDPPPAHSPAPPTHQLCPLSREGWGGGGDLRADDLRVLRLGRYECPAASRTKSTRHLEDAAFRQGFAHGFVDAGSSSFVEESDSFTEGDESNHSFFPPVALPAAPSPIEVEAADARKAKRAIREPRRAARRVVRQTISADAVLCHLDGALEAINTILADLRGTQPIIESTDTDKLSEEISRRIVERTAGQPEDHRPESSSEQQLASELRRARSSSRLLGAQQRVDFSLTRSVTSRSPLVGLGPPAM
jgi:hypothetical protein